MERKIIEVCLSVVLFILFSFGIKTILGSTSLFLALGITVLIVFGVWVLIKTFRFISALFYAIRQEITGKKMEL